MRYTIKPRGTAHGTFRVVAQGEAAALQTARDLMDRGIDEVEIVDGEGGAWDPATFKRRMAGAMLDADQLRLVQETCDVLLSANTRAADIFYDRLFALAPEARALFAPDLAGQKRKLLDTLGSMVGYVSHPDMFARLTSELGRRHVGYGAEPAHFGPVGEALLTALAELLGPRFTPEVRAAWTSLYGEIATAMIRAQAGSRNRSVRA